MYGLTEPCDCQCHKVEKGCAYSDSIDGRCERPPSHWRHNRKSFHFPECGCDPRYAHARPTHWCHPYQPSKPCPEGCYPEGSEDGYAEIDFDAWTCIGGELNMLYDRREG